MWTVFFNRIGFAHAHYYSSIHGVFTFQESASNSTSNTPQHQLTLPPTPLNTTKYFPKLPQYYLNTTTNPT